MKMKNNLKNFIILVFLGLTIYLCFRNYHLSQEVDYLYSSNSIHDIPDTVYEDKKFKPVTPNSPYSQKIEPGRIKIYLQKEEVFTHTHNNNSDSGFQSKSYSLLSKTYETFPPFISRQDSLVQILLSKGSLNLSLFNQESGTYSTREFKIDLEKYSYNWYQGQLTRKKKLLSNFKIHPYAYTQYRFLNSFFDLGSGIGIKTNSFNYKLGINYFNYPGFKSGTDLELRVTYNF